jgi:hypothetical protein
LLLRCTRCFTIDPQLGLVFQSNSARTLGLNQTTPPSGPFNTASQVIFTEDGSQLVAAVKGFSSTAPGFLTMWYVLADGSGLSNNSTIVLSPAGGAVRPVIIHTIQGSNRLGLVVSVLTYPDTRPQRFPRVGL